MIEELKTLKEFTKYCEVVIEEDNDNDATDWLLFALGQKLTEENLSIDINSTLTIYYKWLNIAQKKEMFLECGIIYQAIEIESAHYNKLGKQFFKKSIKKEIADINSKLKTKYLYA